ncbi:MAG: hypothetical protein M1281_14135 [Chloroflexi bacterium]|nr:hypothetical protein [Chloroflexota bacterium]
MKKLVFPLMIAIMMMAAVTPAFAKEKPPTGNEHGQGWSHSQNPKNTPQPGVTQELKQNGKPEKDKTGNPHGMRQNFLLFGTVTAIGVDDLGSPTITVQVTSGNNLVQVNPELATPLVINVMTDTVIRQLGAYSHLINLEEVTIGSYVRVHGWFVPGTPVEEVTPPADTSVDAETPVPDAWNARQIFIMNDGTDNGETLEPEG